MNIVASELRQHASSVDLMRPQIDAMHVSRSKLVVLASLGLFTLWVLGRAMEAGITWVVMHFLNIKLSP